MDTEKSLWEFVHDVTHELRNPITICIGYLELLGEEPKERRRTIALVIDELDRMGRMVDDLQLLAEAEHSDLLHSEPVDIGLFAQELTAEASAVGSRRWMLDHSGEGTFIGDRYRLTQAVVNLARNAVQNTRTEQAVVIGTSLSEAEVCIWVRDTGPGIAVSDQACIFDPFTRGKDARRRYRGGGLGLAVVRAIAEAHGGRVELDSRLGKGSTFRMVLPRHVGEATTGDQPQ